MKAPEQSFSPQLHWATASLHARDAVLSALPGFHPIGQQHLLCGNPSNPSGGVHADGDSGTEGHIVAPRFDGAHQCVPHDSADPKGRAVLPSLQAAAQEAMKGAFRPESVNGLDKIVVPRQLFKPQDH